MQTEDAVGGDGELHFATTEPEPFPSFPHFEDVTPAEICLNYFHFWDGMTMGLHFRARAFLPKQFKL